jgi:Hemerythrin HHE cation binding domain
MVDIDGDMTDIGALVAADHAKIHQLFIELHRDTDTPGVHRALVRDLLTELTGHCEAEQRTVYPAVEEELGRDEAEGLRRDHDEVDRLIGAVLEAPGEPQQRLLLADLERCVRAHMDREERETLPRLAGRIGIKGRSSLAAAYSQTQEAYSSVVIRRSGRRAG